MFAVTGRDKYIFRVLVSPFASCIQTQCHQSTNQHEVECSSKENTTRNYYILQDPPNWSSNTSSTLWLTGQVILLGLDCISNSPRNVSHTRKVHFWTEIRNVNCSPAYYIARFASYMMGRVFFFCPHSHGKAFGAHWELLAQQQHRQLALLGDFLTFKAAFFQPVLL